MVTAGGNTDDGFGKFFWDGLHFSKEGHNFVLEALLGAIQTEFPSLSVTPDRFTGQANNSGSSCEGIPSSGPYHDKINHVNPSESFQAQPEDEREDQEVTKRQKTS